MKTNLVQTKDGSNTLYSSKYNQHFHNVDDGSLNEALSKHIIPALNFHKDKNELHILDICFGLGYNTFTTIWYILENNLDLKVKFYSPELDGELIESLKNFSYPKEFEKIKYIIDEVLEKKSFKNEQFSIELFIGDARVYIKKLSNIDIVYQDAFSADVNKELWTKEYFQDIYNCTNKNCAITTYAISTNIRLSQYESGFEIYEFRSDKTKRKQTLAVKEKLQENENLKYIDMELKQQRNTEAKSLSDQE